MSEDNGNITLPSTPCELPAQCRAMAQMLMGIAWVQAKDNAASILVQAAEKLETLTLERDCLREICARQETRIIKMTMETIDAQ